MNQVPAGWHDDPEDPQQYRYWDGTQWTEHRSSKSASPSDQSRSPWTVIGNALRLAGGNWRDLVLVTSLLQTAQTVFAHAGGIVVYEEVGGTFDAAISSD